jgi:hypothetical protein
MRPLRDLINESESAWPLVQQWISEAAIQVEVLFAERKIAESALLATQVTTRSPMGAVVYNSAGILIDHGWLRILGAGGHPRFQRSLPAWNEGRSDGFYLVADDAVGGFFALNGGALGDDQKNIYYFAPDSLSWEPCEFGYSQFLIWAMTTNILKFYESVRWPNWESEVRKLSGDEAINIYPFLWANGPPIADRSRRAVPVAEIYHLQFDIKGQLESS